MRQVRTVLTGALAWLAVSVPVGILVGKVLKARREEMEETESTERTERMERRAFQAPPVRPGPPSWGPRDHRGVQARRDLPGRPGVR